MTATGWNSLQLFEMNKNYKNTTTIAIHTIDDGTDSGFKCIRPDAVHIFNHKLINKISKEHSGISRLYLSLSVQFELCR